MEQQECQWYDVGCGIGWLVDELKLLFQWFFEGILGAFAAVLEAIPVPDFMLQIQNTTFNFPDSVTFWINMFELPFGLAVMVSAITLRFILRRIPVIG